MEEKDIKKFQEKFPFLTGINYGGKEHVGIVQNYNNQLTTIYDYDKLRSEEQKQTFLEIGETWWWESNRIVPINIFLPKEMEYFKYSLCHMITKDVEFIFGPVISLNNIAKKRIKRRSIQLVRKID